MQLGVFSLSLAVKDLEVSRQFYEKFGFSIFGGDASQGWLILKNGNTVLGLFKGMFEKNMLTFNHMSALRSLLLAAPVVFAVHVLEEAPGFVTWVNGHIDRDITQSSFWTVNFTALLITLAVIFFEWMSASRLSAIVVLTWLGVLMVGNAALHIGAAVVDGAYVPGVVTAILLYLPFSALVVARLVRSRRVSSSAAAVAVVLGAIPMLAHGYMILFRGTRLF